MRMTDLRWEHMARVLSALRTGHTAAQARAAAGIGPKLWANMRSNWDTLPSIIDKNDPHGSKVDLSLVDGYVAMNKGRGGRPPGVKDSGGPRSVNRRMDLGLSRGTLLDHPWFCDE